MELPGQTLSTQSSSIKFNQVRGIEYDANAARFIESIIAGKGAVKRLNHNVGNRRLQDAKSRLLWRL